MPKVTKNIVLTNIVGSYVNIVEPKKKMNSEELEYSLQIVMPDGHKDLPKLQETIASMLKEAHGDQSIQSYGLRKQETADGVEWYINARKGVKFGAVPVFSRANVPITPTVDTVFSGCIFNAQLSLYTFEAPGNRGVGAGIIGLQIVDNTNVTRLDGQSTASAFAALPDDGSDAGVVGGGEDFNTKEVEAAPEPRAVAPSVPW